MGRMADIDEMMYSCGLEILHPGGIEKTDHMAKMCRVGKDKKILDIGSGKGATACFLAQKYDCDVVGVDLSERMIEFARKTAAKKGMLSRVTFRRADALSLPFEDQSFDIVLIECTTTLLPDKQKAFTEFLRVTKPGGGIGDLEMIWKKPPGKEIEEKVFEVWEGFRTMTIEEWRAFFERQGMADIEVLDFSDAIPDMGKAMKRELGLRGMLRMGYRLLIHSHLRKALLEYSRIFKQYADYIGYACIAGMKKTS